ncbi:MAG: hypothetical protein ACE5JX_18050 [Acidobacteriota bacterium]
MTEVEKAYHTLEVRLGAPLKEVMEAHEDLLALWDPDRLAEYPRLRSKAATKIRAINAAYEALMEHLGHTHPGRAASPVGVLPPQVAPGRLGAAPKATGPSSTGRPTVSLFEDIFSERASRGKRPIPVLPIVLGTLVVALAIGYFALSPSPPEELPGPGDRLAASPGSSEAVSGLPESPTAEAPPGSEVGHQPTESMSPLVPERVVDSNGREPARTVPRRPDAAPGPKAAPAPTQRGKPSPSAPKRPPRGTDVGSSRKHSGPVLIRDPAPPSGESKASDSARPISSEHSKAEFETYQTLLQNAPVARRLAQGGFGLLQIEGWKVIQRKASETWIDLIVNGSNGETVHFVWSVDTQDGTTRALSQAARNLELEVRSQR